MEGNDQMSFEEIRYVITAVSGGIGILVDILFGGWSDGLAVLLVLMGIDYISGLIVAGVFHKSSKSQDGKLESRAGLKGLFRKGGILVCVLVAHLLDIALGKSFVIEAVILAFIANEGLSIVENLGLAGIPIPTSLKRSISQLADKNEKENKK